MKRRSLPTPVAIAEVKQRGRPWKPGQSGNPAGRKKGHRFPVLAALDAIGQENVQDLLRQVVAQALAGDMVAARIILDRCWPAPKGRLIPLNLPVIKTVRDLSDAHDAVLKALSEALITTEEGAGIINLLENRRRIIETLELETRITSLEKGLNRK